jgi:FSR family fosmidomycin resistance protein-like MFS transporter
MKYTTDEKKFQLSSVLLISVVHFFHDSYSAFLFPLLPLLIEKLSLSYTVAASLYFLQRIPSLGNPLIGLITDRSRTGNATRYLLIATPTVTAASMCLIPSAPNFIAVAFLLLISGMSSCCFHVPTPVLIRHYSGKKIGTGMSFYMLAGELSRSLGPLAIIAAISLWGMSKTYRLTLIGILTSIVMYYRLRAVPAQISVHSEDKKIKIHSIISRLKKMLIIVFGISFSKAILSATLVAFLPTYLTAKGSTLWAAGASLSILQFSGAAGTFISGSLSDRLGRKKMLFLITSSSPFLMFLFLIAPGWLKIPMLIFSGFFIFSVPPILMALIQENEIENPSLANGLYMTINFMLSSLLVVFVGFLGDKIGLDATYRLCTLLSFAGIPFVLMLPGKLI